MFASLCSGHKLNQGELVFNRQVELCISKEAHAPSATLL